MLIRGRHQEMHAEHRRALLHHYACGILLDSGSKTDIFFFEETGMTITTTQDDVTESTGNIHP